MLLVTVMELCPRVREISNMGTPWLLATEAKLALLTKSRTNSRGML